MAELLGFRLRPEPSPPQGPKVSKKTDGRVPKDPPPELEPPPPVGDWPYVPLLRTESATWHDEGVRSELPRRSFAPAGMARGEVAPPRAAARWSVGEVEKMAFELTHEVVCDGPVDIERCLETLARGETLRRVPRAAVRRLVSRVEFHWDRRDELAPAVSDGHALIRALRRAAPDRVASFSGREADRVVVIGDASTPAIVTQADRHLCWTGPGRPLSLGSEWASVVGVLGHPVDTEHVERLAVLASLASSLHGDLLRSLRVLVCRDARVELQLWADETRLLRGPGERLATWARDARKRTRDALIRRCREDAWLTPERLVRAVRTIQRYRWSDGAPQRIWWLPETTWAGEVTSWRLLSGALPEPHATALEALLDREGWADENHDYLADLASAALYEDSRFSVAAIQRWLEQHRGVEPEVAFEEGGLYRDVVAALLEHPPTEVARVGVGTDGIGLGLELGSRRSWLADLPTGPGVVRVKDDSGEYRLVKGEVTGAIPLEPATNEPDTSWADAHGYDEFGIYAVVDLAGAEHRFRWIAPGTFWMGSPEEDDEAFGDEMPRHRVTLTEGYWMAETPCTQAQWTAVMGKNPSTYKGADRPVEYVSWEDITSFLAAAEKHRPELGLRLPTEAQWERACRAGTDEPRYGPLEGVAWFYANSKMKGTRPVAQKAPNPAGLFDTLGNVNEWCRDGMRDYDMADAIDPMGPMDMVTKRVIRGGSWVGDAKFVRAAYRFASHPSYRHDGLGFRVSRGPGAPGPGGPSGAEPRRPGRGTRPGASSSGITLVTDRATLGLGVFARPDWASVVGRDRYGLFAEVDVPGEGVMPVRFRLRWIPPGRFLMGAPDSEEGHSYQLTQHRVTLTAGYWLADTPCTQQLWETVAGKNPSSHRDPRAPVTDVSWEDVDHFLGQLGGRVPGLEPVLPTEAQWEYACRAGTEGARYGPLDEVAWYDENAREHALAVGDRCANPWGLVDMLGNVDEWCRDGLRDYDMADAIDPMGPMDLGTERVFRGGNWTVVTGYARAACRIADHPSERYDDLGFRVSRGPGALGPGGSSGSGAEPPGPGRGTRPGRRRDPKSMKGRSK